MLLNVTHFLTQIRQLFPGIGVVCVTGMAASFLGQHYGVPTMLFALLLGMSTSFLYSNHSECQSGIEFISKDLLRVGVALLGFRISLSDFSLLGWSALGLIAIAILSTIVVGVLLAKVFKLSAHFGALTGGAVSICGASAALALSSIMPNSPHKERDTLLTIIGVTTLSTVAMVLYPILSSYFGLSDTAAGFFVGATIHDVAQVVGAGYSISESAGDVATLTKMVRVALLVPVVLLMLYVFRITNKNKAHNVTSMPTFPLFLVAFITFMLLNSFIDFPEWMLNLLKSISSMCLVIAIAAIGMKSNFASFKNMGIYPIILMVIETVWISVIVLLYILWQA